MCQKKGGGTVSGFLGGIFINLQAEGIYPSFCEEENIKCFVAGAWTVKAWTVKAFEGARCSEGPRLQEPSCNIWINSVPQIK